MEKIKCIRSLNGEIIPIHNIAIISEEKYSHYIWTNSDNEENDMGHELSEKSYRRLLNELDIIDGGFID